MKTELEYKKNTLFVRITGYINQDEVQRLKQKMYCIINEYGITELKFYLKDASNIDITMFHEFMPLCRDK